MSTTQAAAEGAALAATGKVANAATVAGSASAILFGLSANEIAAFAGVAVGALGMIVNAVINAYFKRQHLKLARERARGACDDQA